MLIESLVRAASRPPAAKAVTGPGAWAMESYPAVDAMDDGQRDPQAQRRFMRDAIGLYHTNRHILRAERVVASRVAGIPWHLEDPEDTEVDDEYPNEQARDVRALLEKPTKGQRVGNQPVTWRELIGITVRHMGLVNVAFWYLDEIDRLTRWPQQIMYVRPDRMTPVTDARGNLAHWQLDADNRGGGTRLELDEVLPFYLEVPDHGFYGSGLVEAAVNLARKLARGDRHELDTLSSGGRLPGIVSPKEVGVGDEVFKRLQADLRNIAELPDATKRTLVARAPIDWTPTSAQLGESGLNWPELARLTREEIYGLWGVNPATAGFVGPGGLASGENRKYDEASTWQNGIQPRVDALYETLQYQLLDRLDVVGINVELVLDVPSFDDDMPKFDMAEKAKEQPLTQAERRALLGLEPFGDARDDEVWIGDRRIYPVAVVPTEPAAKAKLDDTEQAFRSALSRFLEKQAGAVVSRLAERSGQVQAKPGDWQAWWDGARWDDELSAVLTPHWRRVADQAATEAQQHAPAKASFVGLLGGPVWNRLLKHLGARVRDINETTRREIAEVVKSGVNEGLSMAELGRRIQDATAFNSDRAERIARTETGTTWNMANVESYREFGTEKVRVIDGDGDEVCANANGQEWTLDEALNSPLGHPNCVRDFAPVTSAAKAAPTGGTDEATRNVGDPADHHADHHADDD